MRSVEPCAAGGLVEHLQRTIVLPSPSKGLAEEAQKVRQAHLGSGGADGLYTALHLDHACLSVTNLRQSPAGLELALRPQQGQQVFVANRDLLVRPLERHLGLARSEERRVGK